MPLPPGCPNGRPPYPEVTEVNCRVPSASFSQAPWYTLPVHLCRFRVRSDGGLFPGTCRRPTQFDKGRQRFRSVTSSWPTNINVVPIDYAFRPRLRSRLTLRGLTLRRNPWDFDESVSHTLLVTHVRILTCDTSSNSRESPSQAYTMLRYYVYKVHILSFGKWL